RMQSVHSVPNPISLRSADLPSAVLECRVGGAHLSDSVPGDARGDGALGLTDTRDDDAHGVDQPAVPAVPSSTLGRGSDVDGVLDGSGVQQRLPVLFLQRSAYPGGRYDEHIRAGVDEGAAVFREAQVVAGHQAEADVADVQDGWDQLALLQPVGLAV